MSAVFTYKWKGEQLARLVDNGSRVVMHITVATHCTRPNAHVNRTSVLFVSISFVVLMLTSLAWLVFYYVQRFRYLHAKDRLSKRLCNAAKKALSKIPTREIQQEDREVQGDGECCAVCIEPYKVTDDLRILPCRHEFHKGCIDPWLLEHRTCPMCKMNILKHYGFVFTNSQESVLQVDLERGENDESNTLGTVTDNEIELRVETEIQNNASNFQNQNLYCVTQTESDEEQSDQLLNCKKEYQQSCKKCCSKPDKIKKQINLKPSNRSNCIHKQNSSGLSLDTAQLLNHSSNKALPHQKFRAFSCEDTKNTDESNPSQSKSFNFYDTNDCDTKMDIQSNSCRSKSASCNDITNSLHRSSLGNTLMDVNTSVD